MGGENIAHQLQFSQYECYPGVEESDAEDEADVMSQSYDLHAGNLYLGLHYKKTYLRLSFYHMSNS